jgi:hypothetical protein
LAKVWAFVGCRRISVDCARRKLHSGSNCDIGASFGDFGFSLDNVGFAPEAAFCTVAALIQ